MVPSPAHGGLIPQYPLRVSISRGARKAGHSTAPQSNFALNAELLSQVKILSSPGYGRAVQRLSSQL